MNELNVMYICDDRYAEIAGISILSMFENNNSNNIKITVYLLGVKVSKENKDKLLRLGQNYGQSVVFIDAEEEYKNIEKTGINGYRGSIMTNLRLYFAKLIPAPVDRILYIDCDTIVCGSLLDLCDFPMNGKMLAMAYDAYGKIFTDDKNSAYYNAGVILIDSDKWRSEKWQEKIEDFIYSNSELMLHPDQDVFNKVCKDEIVLLPAKYNLQLIHRVVDYKLYSKFLIPQYYYCKSDIENANEAPTILHLVRYLGTNPWKDDGRWHPDYDIYANYKKKTEWRDNGWKKEKASFAIKCERILSKILPRMLFFHILIIAISLMNKCGKEKI